MNKLQYRDAIINLIKQEYTDINNEQKIITRLNQASEDELNRMYDAISRFGARMIFDSVKQ